MEKIETLLPKLYQEMHSKGVFLGDTWRHYWPKFASFLGPAQATFLPVLDFGCGPLGGLRMYGNALSVVSRLETPVICYDPHIDEFKADPWDKGAKTFFSCDVFEHMTVPQIRFTLKRICKSQIDKIFIALSIRAANKIMPNGLNAHLTVHGPEWWQGFFDNQLGPLFECKLMEADFRRNDCVFAFVRRKEETPAE